MKWIGASVAALALGCTSAEQQADPSTGTSPATSTPPSPASASTVPPSTVPPPPAPPPPTAPPPAPSVFVTAPTLPAGLTSPWIDHGVCPGECCTYREWSARTPVEILDAPQGTRVLSRLGVGDKVQALTGDVWVTPRPARVTFARTFDAPAPKRGQGRKRGTSATVQPGDLVWILTPLGEGFSRIWVAGHVYEADTTAVDDPDCTGRTDEACWAVAAPPPREPAPWWVQVTTAGGLTGWVDNARDVLGGYDACG